MEVPKDQYYSVPQNFNRKSEGLNMQQKSIKMNYD
jgi:hypothetical protein